MFQNFVATGTANPRKNDNFDDVSSRFVEQAQKQVADVRATGTANAIAKISDINSVENSNTEEEKQTFAKQIHKTVFKLLHQPDAILKQNIRNAQYLSCSLKFKFELKAERKLHQSYLR